MRAETKNGSPLRPQERAEKTSRQAGHDNQGDRMPPEVTTKITDPPQQRQAPREIRRRVPAAYCSLFAPDGRRRRYGIAYACPHCNRHHFGLSWTPNVDGTRKSGCGRLVRVVIARRYPAAAFQGDSTTQASEVHR